MKQLLFKRQEITELEDELKDIRHRLFSSKFLFDKSELRKKDKELRNKIAVKLEENELTKWDPYDQNNTSPFFDMDWMFGIKDGFDIVIGNPPYGVSIKGENRKIVLKHLAKVPDYEIYYFFIEASKKLLKKNRMLSYIIPNTFLFNVFADKFRRSLIKYWGIEQLIDCTNFYIFDGATVKNTILLFRNNIPSSKIGYINTKNSFSFQNLIERPIEYISKKEILNMNQNWGLAFKLDKNIINIINKIRINNLLKIYFDVSQGYIPYRKSDLVKKYGKEKGSKIVENREWHSLKQENINYKQEIFGRNISKCNYQKTNSFVKYGEHLACYVNPKFFTNTRILIREITNPTIIACLIEEEFVNDPQLISIINKSNVTEEASLKLLWCLLNSRLATFYHFNASPKASKGAFPKILVKDIKEFPIPSNFNKDIKLLKLHNKIMEIAKDGEHLRDEQKKLEFLELETEIDARVAHLYNLTEKEYSIILKNTEDDFCTKAMSFYNKNKK